MIPGETVGLFVGAVALGAVHGIEPGHGWPVAASYALDQANKWVYGFAASGILGVGHLVSSVAMVGVFFYAKSYFDLTRVNEPITLVQGVRIGGPVSLVAGVVLVLLGIHEYRHGHSHGSSTGEHDHLHTNGGDPPRGLDRAHEHSHEHAHEHDPHEHAHEHGDLDEAAERGLLGIAWFAFLLGFAHEEEFEIIALCAGSNYCLELMTAYAIAVVVGIVGLTMLLIAGYQHYRETVERYAPYLPAFSAAVLIGMGLGFVLGLL